MGSVNKAILVGNLGRDAELKFTGNGFAIARFSIATADRRKDSKTGSGSRRPSGTASSCSASRPSRCRTT